MVEQSTQTHAMQPNMIQTGMKFMLNSSFEPIVFKNATCQKEFCGNLYKMMHISFDEKAQPLNLESYTIFHL